MFRSSEGSISEARKVLHRLRIAELLLPADPGGLRLLAALRATLAGVLTFFLVVLLGTVAPLPVTDRILGFGIALVHRRQRARPDAAAAADHDRPGAARSRCLPPGLAAVLFDQPLAAATLLPLIMFAVAYGATCGPRWASLGIVALIAYFIGLVTHDPPSTLPMRFVVLLIAAGVAALIRWCCCRNGRGPNWTGCTTRSMPVSSGCWTASPPRSPPALGPLPGAGNCARTSTRLDEMVMLAQARAAATRADVPDRRRTLDASADDRTRHRAGRARRAAGSRHAGRPRRAAGRADGHAARQRAAGRRQSTKGLPARLALLAHVMHEAPATVPAPAAAPPAAASAARPAFRVADRGSHRTGDRGR